MHRELLLAKRGIEGKRVRTSEFAERGRGCAAKVTKQVFACVRWVCVGVFVPQATSVCFEGQSTLERNDIVQQHVRFCAACECVHMPHVNVVVQNSQCAVMWHVA